MQGTDWGYHRKPFMLNALMFALENAWTGTEIQQQTVDFLLLSYLLWENKMRCPLLRFLVSVLDRGIKRV